MTIYSYVELVDCYVKGLNPRIIIFEFISNDLTDLKVIYTITLLRIYATPKIYHTD